jgi:hypothetical protein
MRVLYLGRFAPGSIGTVEGHDASHNLTVRLDVIPEPAAFVPAIMRQCRDNYMQPYRCVAATCRIWALT